MGKNPAAFGKEPELSDEEVLEFMEHFRKVKEKTQLSNRTIGIAIGYSDGTVLGQIGHIRKKNGYDVMVRPSRERLEAMRRYAKALLNGSTPATTSPKPVPARSDSVMNHLDRANSALLVALKELDEAKALSVPLLQPGLVELRSRLSSLRSWLEVS